MRKGRWQAGGHGTGRIALAATSAVLLGGLLTLTACSGAGNGTNASSAAAPQGGAAAGRAPYAAPGDSSAGSSSGSAAGPGTAVKLPSRDLIITAGLQVKTSDAAKAAAQAQSVVQAAGGYVANESIGTGSQITPVSPGAAASSGVTDGGTAPAPVTLPDVTDASDSTQALLVLRVPPRSVDSVLTALAGKGTVTYQSRTATDVTGQVADVASRVTSAQAAIAELRTLIDKAASMNDLISLEQALSQRESDLESLEAQQKALADQVQYATITVGYFTQGQPAAPPPVRSGFMRGLTAGWHGFLTAVRGLLAAIGWLLPFATVVAVLWWPVRRLVRWGKGRRGGVGNTAGTAALASGGAVSSEGSGSSPES